MLDLPVLTDFKALLLADTPLMDVRAPIEFQEGAIPHATNLPLMTNAERAAVGTCYKHKGQPAAIQLGHELVSGAVKAERVAAWREFAQQHPHGALYCFRGGLRSRISQQWLYENTGLLYPRIEGGYKALRRYLLEVLQTRPATLKPLVLSGRTGTGKTELLKPLSNAIDLEGLARHRGSAFGHYPQAQPAQAQFENQLAVQLLKQPLQHVTLVEDECRTIGSVHIPNPLFECMTKAPLVVLQVDEPARLERTYQEYVVQQYALFQALAPANPEQGLEAFTTYLLTSIDKIKSRLGSERYSEVVRMMQRALKHQRLTGELDAHRAWVQLILWKYYDPMYDYQLSRKQQRVVFSGSSSEVQDYIRSLHPA